MLLYANRHNSQLTNQLTACYVNSDQEGHRQSS